LNLRRRKWQEAGEDCHEKLHKLYNSQNIIRLKKLRRMKWEVSVACMGEMRNLYENFSQKRKKQLRRTSCRWEDNIRMDHG
jgi:hypothetical protein